MMARGPARHTLSFGHFLLFEHLIMDKGHERNDSIWAALLNTIFLPYFPAHKMHRPIRCTMIFC